MKEEIMGSHREEGRKTHQSWKSSISSTYDIYGTFKSNAAVANWPKHHE